MIFLDIFGAFFISAHASPQKPVCDAKHITNNCEFFKKREKQQFIALKDGTKFLNPVYSASKFGLELDPNLPQGGYAPSASGGGVDASLPMGYGGPMNADILAQLKTEQEIFLAEQSEIIDNLDSLKASTRFKLAYAKAKLEVNPDAKTISVPWPPGETNAKFEEVSVVTVEEFLKKEMPKNSYVVLENKVKQFSEPRLKKKRELAQKLGNVSGDQLKSKKQLDEEAAKDLELFEKKKKRIPKLFEEAQRLVIATIERGRKRELLDDDEKILIQKVETIKLAPENSPQSRSGLCNPAVQNAVYLPVIHQFVICKESIPKSDADLIGSIAHELGHSIDPCNARFPLYKVDKDALAAQMKNPKVSSQVKRAISSFTTQSANYINVDLDFYIDEQEFNSFLLESKILVPLNGGVKRHPFEKEYQCLVKELNFKENSETDIKYNIETLKELTSGAPLNPEVRQASMDRYQKAAKKYPQCLRTLGVGRKIQEAMSDVFSAPVVEKFMLDNPPKSEEEKVSAFMSARLACTPQVPLVNSEGVSSIMSSEPLTQGSLAPNTLGAQFAFPSLHETHADHAIRAEKILLNLPGIAKLLDCKRTVPACIDHLSFANRTTSKSGKETTNTNGAIK